MPFTLTTYQDAKLHAARIAAATESRRMPPWMPDPGEPRLVGERSLPADAIDTIQRWAKAGTPEGDPRDLPPAPVWPAGWELGQPDLVTTVPRPYRLAPGEHDVYRNLVLRLSLPAARFVRAVEFRPGDAPIHHAVIRIDRTRSSRARDGADGQPGFDGMVAYEVQDPDGHFLGWAPGRGPITAPERTPWILDRDSDLIVELHLMPGESPREVQPSVGLFFTETAPADHPVMIVMGSKAIDIPAGAPDYTIDDRYTLPVDVEVLSVYPHAHYLGREMDARAIAPDGAARPLIHIRQWSFNWQQDYRFVTPIALGQGTTIVMRYS
ncbi:MAG: tetratricopeptide repeat protein, partial [Pseudomonadota bacterium]